MNVHKKINFALCLFGSLAVVEEDTVQNPFIGFSGNYTVPAGTLCIIETYNLHHREDLYKNAHIFDPERFLPENCIGRHPYAYIPFSAGPRNCIGKFVYL